MFKLKKIPKKNFALFCLSLILSMMIFIQADVPDETEIQASRQISFEKEYEDQLNNFVFLMKIASFYDHSDLHSTASGMIISSTNSHVFILTAHHFCISEDPNFIKTEIIAHNDNLPRVAQIIYIDEVNDICLLSGIKFKDEKFKNLKLAKKMPAIGNFVFNVSAPNSMGSPNTRLLFDGHFGGCEEVCVYTIPATFGSSGSAVFNSKGELISILVMATPDFENVGIGPDIYTIRKFIDEVEEIMEIK